MMKIETVDKDQVIGLSRMSKYRQIIEALDGEEHGEYLKVSGISGKDCVLISRAIRNRFYEKAIRLSIRIDAKKNTLYVAKKIEDTRNDR